MVRSYSFLIMNTSELFLPSNEKSLLFATVPIVHVNSCRIRHTFYDLDTRQMLKMFFFSFALSSEGAHCPCTKSPPRIYFSEIQSKTGNSIAHCTAICQEA